jgi:hypothetical protein
MEKKSPSLEFVAPVSALFARLRISRSGAGSVRWADAARGPVDERTPDHSSSSAFEAIRRVCESSAPPGA